MTRNPTPLVDEYGPTPSRSDVDLSVMRLGDLDPDLRYAFVAGALGAIVVHLAALHGLCYTAGCSACVELRAGQAVIAALDIVEGAHR